MKSELAGDRRRPRVVLVDNNAGGHHLEYFLASVESLARLGCRVLALSWIDEREFKGLAPEVRATLTIEYCQIPMRRFQRALGRRLGGWLWGRIYFGRIAKLIRGFEHREGSAADLVFFSCIYDREFDCSSYWRKVSRWPWAGLYLHVRSFRMPGSPAPGSGIVPKPEAFLQGEQFAGAAVLDEKAIDWLQEMTGRPAFFHPDLVSNLAVAEDADLPGKIRELAGGRTVVLLAGHLIRSKGVSEFIEISRRLREEPFYFAFVGSLSVGALSDDERGFMADVEAGKVPNCLGHFERTAPEVFNALVANADVVYAAYRSFPNSSNVMCKAAAFEKPVIVSDGYLMAERCREFQLGAVVAEGDVDEMTVQLQELVEQVESGEWSRTNRCRAFLEAHQPEQLDVMFRQILSLPGSGQ